MCAIVENPILQAVVGGVLVYFAGAVCDKLYIAPLTKYNELRSEICYCLIEYASAYSNPCHSVKELSEWHVKAGDKLRKVASKAGAFAQERKFLARAAIPSKRNLKEISGWLMRLSNSMIDVTGNDIARNRKDANAVRFYLNLDVEDYEGLPDMVSNKRYKKRAQRKLAKTCSNRS